MKKKFVSLIFALFLFFGKECFAVDIIPTSSNSVTVNTVGIYQINNDVTIYKFPDEKSMILYRVRWNEEEFFPETIGAEKFFSLFIANKELAYVNVVDVVDGWVEIVYNNNTGETGWIKEDDPYKFMTWINFYNVYGKKYGLSILKGAPALCKDIKAAPDEKGQTLSTINMPQKIHLNIIRGNWALVSVFDMDKVPKTGYVRWRSDDGVRYYFPSVK